jgi:2-polyprenyl-6-methoxyphenol hydroxylase-like FAD-dependent oxidoreductase
MSAYDVIIVGGGIAGPALAAVLARAGRGVLLLEQTEVYVDRVRGEWISPWGVVETKRLGLYDTLMAAGARHVTRHITFDEALTPQQAEARVLDMGVFFPDVSGPVTIGHPHHCQTLFDAAKAAGADARRGVRVTDVTLGARPSVTFVDADGQTTTATARLVVGADGRTSMVREAAKVALHQDKPHHWFAGLLVEGADAWDPDLQAVGTEGDFAYLAFPQGGGKVRVYGGYALDQTQRFKGPDGPRRFLDAFAMDCAPANRALVDGRPAGPLLAYFNADAWTDEPYVEGAVLAGDAAGWNDPILGLGLSITYRDVRMISDILLASDDWSPDAFRPYGEERRERLRRLRFAAAVQSRLDMEFGSAARTRRERHFERAAVDPSLRLHGLAILAGPERAPADYFTPENFARILELEEQPQ